MDRASVNQKTVVDDFSLVEDIKHSKEVDIRSVVVLNELEDKKVNVVLPKQTKIELALKTAKGDAIVLVELLRYKEKLVIDNEVRALKLFIFV